MSILQGTIPDDWTGEYCRYAVCWPDSPKWLAILRGVLVLPSRGRFWDEDTGNIIDAQNVIRETFDQNLHLREVIMACGDEGLIQAINNIATALTLQVTVGCCDRQGGGGAGTIAPPFSPIEQGVPPTSEPPPGFEEWPDYLSYKCSIAWNIVETLQTDMGELAIMNLGGVSLSSLAALIAIAFATPIPFDDIVAIASLVLTVVGEIVIATTLSILNDNEEDLVCELYNGTTSSNSRDLFLSRFSEFVDSGVADPVTAFACNSLMAYMLGSAATNRLYEEDTTRNWGERDCSNCAGSGAFRQAQANGLVWDDYNILGSFEIGVPVVLDSKLWDLSPDSPAHAVVVEMEDNQITATLSSSAHTQYTIVGCGDYRMGTNFGGGHVGETNAYCHATDFPTGERTFGNLVFYSDDSTPFTLTITRTG